MELRSPIGKSGWTFMSIENRSVTTRNGEIDSRLKSILEKLEFDLNIDASLEEDIADGVLISNDGKEVAFVKNKVVELLPTYFQNVETLKDILRDADSILFEFVSEKVEASRNDLNYINSEVLFSKQSEMSLLEKVDNFESFTNPGLSSPFNKSFHHPTHLIKAFGCAVPFLEVSPESKVLDLGCGYAWTTEWLSKIGIDATGIDINRSYIDVGIIRMNKEFPNLIVGDVENLPFEDNSFDAILGFDAFHHIPDRNKAAKELVRILKPGGRIVFVEPGADHEHDLNSKKVMEKYGIIEKGFTLVDLQGYFLDVLDADQIREVTLMPYWSDDSSSCVNSSELISYRGFIGWGIFQLCKPPKNVPLVYRRTSTNCGEVFEPKELTKQIDMILNSTSWKITYPLRLASTLSKKLYKSLHFLLRF
jgi:SAM-dependent methyltransferase